MQSGSVASFGQIHDFLWFFKKWGFLCVKVAQTTARLYFLLTLLLYSRKICRYDFPIKVLKYNEPDNKPLRVNFRQNFGTSDIKFWVECLLLKIALVADGERKVEFNTEKYSLLRSRVFGCHATLPSKESFYWGARCVTSKETAKWCTTEIQTEPNVEGFSNFTLIQCLRQ